MRLSIRKEIISKTFKLMSHEGKFSVTGEDKLKKKKREPFFSDFIEGIHLVGLEDLCGSHAELILSYIFFVKPFSSKDYTSYELCWDLSVLMCLIFIIHCFTTFLEWLGSHCMWFNFSLRCLNL